MRQTRHLILLLVVTLAATACTGDEPAFDLWGQRSTSRVHTDLTYLRDAHGRYVTVQGVNLGGSTKVPYTVNPLSYIGRPFPLDAADEHFGIIKGLGFNTIRLLYMWEAVEPHAKDEFDQEFLDYFEELIKLAKQHGIYVLINMHENLWSRHLYVDFNRPPVFGEEGDLVGILGATFPDRHRYAETGEWFTDRVQGDGAPLWATKACLPEKADYIGGPAWGTFRPLGSLTLDDLLTIQKLLAGPDDGGESPIDETEILLALGEAGEAGILPETPEQGTDMMPWTFWGVNAALSIDVARCYLALFDGDHAFPGMTGLDGVTPIQDYLQSSYANVWGQIAERAAKYDNVIGYDLMNEPSGIFIILTLMAAYLQSGLPDMVEDLVISLLGPELGQEVADLALGLNIIPKIPPRPVQAEGESSADYQARVAAWEAERDAIQASYGLGNADLMSMLGTNMNFDANFLQPLYERITESIQAADPNAIIWIEQAGTIDVLLGGGIGGQWSDPMTVPQNANEVVWSPHWYPDIYPMLGFAMPPREFTVDEHRFRDYTKDLRHKMDFSPWQFSNVPTVMGEFGTYWNYNGIDWSRENKYIISEQILDNYYEAFEALNLGRIQWCYTADNDYRFGDHWNAEDFSLLDPDQQPRGARAYSRPYARALSGKPLSTYFNSDPDLHYYDTDEAVVDPVHEFEVTFATRETDAPTEIYVPTLQYPNGFYVWLSDGYAAYDHDRQTLFYQPTVYEPEYVHRVLIKQPLDGQENTGWSYFFRGDHVVAGGR